MTAKWWNQPKCPSVDECGTQNVAHPYSRIHTESILMLFRHKKEQSIDTFCNVDEP